MLVSPSLLAADFANLERDIKKVASDADMLHLDIMDGHFVPNISYGVPVVSAVKKVTGLPLDVHLMIENPDRYLKAFIDAGADYLTVHAEASIHLHRTIAAIKAEGCKAGVALNPHTSEEVLRYVIKDLDLILIMTVNPGFGGQSFIPEMLDKIKNVRKMLDDSESQALLMVDGGVSAENIAAVKAAGANSVVAGSAVFRAEDPAAMIRLLQGK